MAEITITLSDKDGKRLERIRDHVTKLWKSSPELPAFTIHDQRHSWVVEHRMHQLLPKIYAEQLNEEEGFLLLASAWLHDVGLINRLFGAEDEKYKDRESIEEIRAIHEKRSERYVVDNAHRLGLDSNEAATLGVICRFHRRKQDIRECRWILPVGPQQIRTRLLVAYLRLADTLQDSSRTPDKEFESNLIMGMDNESRSHWLKARYVQGVIVDAEKCKIEIVLKHPAAYPDARRSKEEGKVLELLGRVLEEEIQDELASVKDTLMEGRLAMYHTVSVVLGGGRVATPYVKDLDELIGSIEVMVSPNASQVISAVFNKILILTDRYDHEDNARISLRYLLRYRNDVLPDFIKKRPCHVVLHEIMKDLDKELRDPNRKKLTPKKINSLKTKSCIDIVGNIVKKVVTRQEKREELWPKFKDQAGKELKELTFSEHDGILLYGNSKSVASLLEGIEQKLRKTITLYICQCGTKTMLGYNNCLRYSDALVYAKRFRDAEFSNIKFVPDTCVAHLLKHGDRNGNKTIKIHKVFFGANGISVDTGDVGHSAGHLNIAQLAEAYGVPVYVVADEMKIGEFKGDPVQSRENNWLTTDIRYLAGIDVFRLEDFNKHSFNPLEDVVPFKMIKGIITEGHFIREVKQLEKFRN